MNLNDYVILTPWPCAGTDNLTNPTIKLSIMSNMIKCKVKNKRSKILKLHINYLNVKGTTLYKTRKWQTLRLSNRLVVYKIVLINNLP